MLLEESLHLMALSAREQFLVLPSYVCRGDEIALIFGDAMLQARTGDFSTIESELFGISEVFDAHDGLEKDEFWGDDALSGHPDWGRIREMARSALARLGITPRRPDLDGHMTYVGPEED